MTVTADTPGIFTTPGEAWNTRTEQSTQTHARPAFIGTKYGHADPAVGIFTGKTFLGILHLDDAERLAQEIRTATRQHQGQD